MKKFLCGVLVFSMFFASLVFAGRLTEKVDKLMQTNQSRERTYYPRDMRPNLLNLHFGYPYMAGAVYSYNINELFSVGVGAGAYFPGIAAGVNVKYYILPTTVSPYLGTGVTYLGTAFTSSTFAVHGEGGVDFALENGLCINLGAVYIISFAESTDTFGTAWGDTKSKLNDLGVEMGLGIRF